MKSKTDIKPTAGINEYRLHLCDFLSDTLGTKATPLSEATADPFEVTVFAESEGKRYKGLFRIWDQTFTVTAQ